MQLCDANDTEAPSIGRPMVNTSLHILDARQRPVPIGVVGEIYIGGIGVARGYLGLPELTAERFIDDPFSPIPGARLYKTGDLGRWRPDGRIDFLGRNDQQLKLRGFRIEPGEIEARLMQLSAVREALVVLREDTGHQRLVAYVTPRGEDRPDPEMLRTRLKAGLPDYMVPAAFVCLPALPLTPNGKVDRRALPAPDQQALALRHYETPQGETEVLLASLWQELLQLERVGRHDHFFDLGGHSLTAMALITRLQGRGARASLAELFQRPVLKDLAEALDSAAAVAPPAGAQALLLQAGAGGGTPLFFVPELSGEVLPYVQLSALLPLDGPIYGLALPAGCAAARASVPELAGLYAAALREVQPRGPYRLAGWSLGGLLAWEVAKQLGGTQDEVEFLGLIDAYTPAALAGLDNSDEIAALLGHVKHHGPQVDLPALRELIGTRGLEAGIAHCRQTGWLPRDFSAAELRQALAANRASARLVGDYRVPSLDLPVHLFTADDGHGEDASRGWRPVAGRQLQLSRVGGSHASIMKLPHVARLAAAIARVLPRRAPGASPAVEAAEMA
ncbi:thioesterase domain-containing protein [Aquabacterium sp. A7-Y]|nr:thioesterase domain-containing protein [Aquabacterium sp. A7-Y]